MAKPHIRTPRWISVQWPGTCQRCGQQIAKGARAFYYPSGKRGTIYCDRDKCGQACERDFDSAMADETYLG